MKEKKASTITNKCIRKNPPKAHFLEIEKPLHSFLTKMMCMCNHIPIIIDASLI